jgi:hypothetical protein
VGVQSAAGVDRAAEPIVPVARAATVIAKLSRNNLEYFIFTLSPKGASRCAGAQRGGFKFEEQLPIRLPLLNTDDVPRAYRIGKPSSRTTPPAKLLFDQHEICSRIFIWRTERETSEVLRRKTKLVDKHPPNACGRH